MIPPFDWSVSHPFADYRAKFPLDLARALTSQHGPMGTLVVQVSGENRTVDYLEKRDGTKSSIFVSTARGAMPHGIPLRAAQCIVRYAKLCGVVYCDGGRSLENTIVFFLGHDDPLPTTHVVFSFRETNRPHETIVLADLTLPIDTV